MIDAFWVIEEDGAIAGCCCLEIYSPKIAEVRSLAVRPASRGRGYGARLVDTAIAEAQRRNIPQVLVVTSNLEFFGRLNFKTCLNEKYALFWEKPEGDPVNGPPETGPESSGRPETADSAKPPAP
jgi:N-acetylglutamate synthase-like GNAT family acetyltransferase